MAGLVQLKATGPQDKFFTDDPEFTFFIENFKSLFFPTLLGSLPIAIIVWFITYRFSKFFLEKKYYEKKNKIRSQY